MSLGSETVKHSIFRSSLIAALIALSGEAAAIGLGELRGKAALGDKPRFEVDILGAGAGSLDSGCFRLKKPDFFPLCHIDLIDRDSMSRFYKEFADRPVRRLDMTFFRSFCAKG